MKKIFCLIAILAIVVVQAQTISKPNLKLLQKIEDTLKMQGKKMVMDEVAPYRFRADSFFTKVLVRALKVSNSFYYNFDSVPYISKVYAPDSSFRIYTWEFMKDESYFRQRGAIQMKTKDGSLKLIPLFDNSEFTNNPLDSVRTAKNWIGAIYYNIVHTTFNNKNYYTLIGFDNNNFRTNKKWIEVMTFNDNGQPQFGGKYFQYVADSVKTPPGYRFLLEYKKDAAEKLTYDKEMNMIVFEHLVSEAGQPELKHTLIPDGDFEGFKWQAGKWVQVSKLFDYKIDMTGVNMMMGKPPVEQTILDATGKRNEQKLIEQSEKNKLKNLPTEPTKEQKQKAKEKKVQQETEN